MRVVRFYHSCSSSSSSSASSSFLPPSSLLPSSPIFIANLLRQSASPILSGQLRIAVCTPGPQPQGSPRSVIFREVNSHTKVVHQVQDDLYHQKKFNYLDQSRIRSEQGRMKFYVFLFLAFFTCFDQFSTCLNIFSHFYSIFHIFLACFHFIFVFFSMYYFWGKHLKHNMVNQIVFLGEKLS